MLDNNIYTVSQCIESKSTIQGKIDIINQLIAALTLKTLDAVDGAIYDEYQLNDGQMTIRAKYRSVEDVAKGILQLTKIKNMYLADRDGRSVVLRSGNIIPFRGC